MTTAPPSRGFAGIQEASRRVTETARSLTSSIAAGDTAAFGRFYGAWFDAALAEAHRCSHRDEQFCLDIVQEAMLRVIRGLPPMESDDDIRRWLRIVITRLCHDRLRSDRRRAQREQGAASAKAAASRTDHDPGTAEVDSRLAWLRAELRSLDAGRSHLLGLRFRCDLTLQRIGVLLGLKAGAVDGRITRAVEALRKKALEKPHDS